MNRRRKASEEQIPGRMNSKTYCGSILLFLVICHFLSIFVVVVAQKRYDKCNILYTNRTSCNNDNVTFGGCVWCDIVDRNPFCTEIYIAKTFPSPPQWPPWRCDKNITPGPDKTFNLRPL